MPFQGQEGELSPSDKALLDSILATDTLEVLFDQLLRESQQLNMSGIESNLPVFNHHPLQHVENATHVNRTQEKLSFFLYLASQVFFSDLFCTI